MGDLGRSEEGGRGRVDGKDEVPRRSRSAGAKDASEKKDLEAVNDLYQGRRRGGSVSDCRHKHDYAHSSHSVGANVSAGTPSFPIHLETIDCSEGSESGSLDSPARPKSMSALKSDMSGLVLVEDEGGENEDGGEATRLRSHSLDDAVLDHVEQNFSVEEHHNEGINEDMDDNGENTPSSLSIVKVSSFHIPEHPGKDFPVNINPELAKFGIGDETIIEHFSCALIPKRGLLTHGRMFITKNHIAFSGWPELRVLIPLESVDELKKTNTVYIIPNAITVHTVGGELYFFGSFIDRDPCFDILSYMVNIARSLVQVMGSEPSSMTDPTTEGNDLNLVAVGAGSTVLISPDNNSVSDNGELLNFYKPLFTICVE